jgi:hypothetical protein
LSAIVLFACALFSGSATANQIVNGDFSSGHVGFTSGYNLVAANGTAQTVPGDIGLTTNPATGFTNGYNSYDDHTGNPGGLMLLVDGYYPGIDAWAETVSVAPSGTYTFTGWVASPDPYNVPVLGLFANGSQVGPSFTAPASAGIWTEWTATLTTSSAATALDLSIQDLSPNPYVYGDDFTLDDLLLTGPATTATPEPSTLALSALALLVCAIAKSQWFLSWSRRTYR